jgi:hypothetical protein
MLRTTQTRIFPNRNSETNLHPRSTKVIMFRILSLDGRGIKGAFTASVLTTIERVLQEPIEKYFDLIAETSTEGILTLGLGLRLRARKIMDFFRDTGPTIFPITGRLGISRFFCQVRRFFPTKHSHAKLRAALVHWTHERGSKNSLIIPTRKASAKVVTAIAPVSPSPIGASKCADLESSQTELEPTTATYLERGRNRT